MVLNEAFRMQNYLDSLINYGIDFLENKNNIVNKKQDHLIKRANPEADNESIVVPKPELFENENITPTVIVSFVNDVILQKEILTAAITEVKRKSIDMDGEISLNKIRQDFASTLKAMNGIKGSETIISGRASKMDNDGRQTFYTYDIKETSTIDFDRNYTKLLQKSLSRKCDEISAKLDILKATADVNYIPKYEIGDSFEECINAFLSNK